MKIEHVAIWANDIEVLKDFYVKYFSATANDKYTNKKKGFTSYFLAFPDGGCRLEVMHKNDIPETNNDAFKQFIGIIHLAISVGSQEKVKELTMQLAEAGYTIVDNPRRTGDGYYESVVLDPENNRLEITE